MNNEAKATPRPWIQSEFYDWCITDKKHHEEEINDWYVVECFGDSNEERKANVQLVLRAVNNHEALLEACRLAEKAFEKLEQFYPENSTGLTMKAHEALTQVIQQASK